MESAGTWAAFIAARIERGALAVPPGGRVDRYRIDEVRAVRGEKVAFDAGWNMARIESPRPIGPQFWDRRLDGVSGHLFYTDAQQKRELDAISIGERSPRAVLIPIVKSAAWWALAQDERQAHFRKGPSRDGHTAIGQKYADRIHRKLYHSRYLPDSSWDFLTYFEFESAHESDFRALLSALRDPAASPEWSFVERECEIWMTRAGA
jgi:hypothetical protein